MNPFDKILMYLLLMLAISSNQTLGQEENLEELLNKADQALSEKPVETSKKSKSPIKEENSLDKEATEQPKKYNADKKKNSPSSSKKIKTQTVEILQPLPDENLKQVLSIEKEALQSEQDLTQRDFSLATFVGIHNMTTHYSLTKDDDTFSISKNQPLVGGLLSFTAVINTFNLSKLHQSFGLALSSGYFQGTLQTQRTGIIEAENRLLYRMVPIDIEATILTKFYQQYTTHISYGITAEYLHQSGDGYYDTVSDIFMGDAFSFIFERSLNKQLSLNLLFKKHGIFSNKTSSAMFLIGLSNKFAG
ncbi:MAG: hypothetical protein R3B45_03845 [Bdellovibrionota bacterium]